MRRSIRNRLDIAIRCRKSEIRLSLLDEQSCACAFQDRWSASLRSKCGQTVRKNFLAKIPCNPLISLVSDERIQGIPRKSNTLKQGNSLQNHPGPRKSNLPRPLPAALVALAPIADRAALVLEAPPFATRLGKRRLVAAIEHENRRDRTRRRPRSLQRRKAGRAWSRRSGSRVRS